MTLYTAYVASKDEDGMQHWDFAQYANIKGTRAPVYWGSLEEAWLAVLPIQSDSHIILAQPPADVIGWLYQDIGPILKMGYCNRDNAWVRAGSWPMKIMGREYTVEVKEADAQPSAQYMLDSQHMLVKPGKKFGARQIAVRHWLDLEGLALGILDVLNDCNIPPGIYMESFFQNDCGSHEDLRHTLARNMAEFCADNLTDWWHRNWCYLDVTIRSEGGVKHELATVKVPMTMSGLYQRAAMVITNNLED